GVFGFGGFAFRIGNFVEQGFVGFVGFDGAGLVAVFAGAFFPLGGVEIELLALFQVGGVGFFGGCDGGACSSESDVELADVLGQGFEAGPEGGDLVVDGLDVD